MHFPDRLFHGVQGHLFPWDVRSDPADAAHLSTDGEGRIRFRLVIEPVLASAYLVLDDGKGLSMEMVGRSDRPQVWEAAHQAESAFRYTFALETDGGNTACRVPAGIGNAVERLHRWVCDPATVSRIDVP